MLELKKVGFIGIGNMGWPMAANLVAGGYEVTAFDARPDQARRWAQENSARATADLAELGRAADVVVTMLPTGREVHDALLRMDNGALAANLRAGSIVVDMSSADPVGTRALGKELAERGIAVVDAPVSGGAAGAKNASLAIMIGGDPVAVAAVRPMLETMGKMLFDLGGLGCGHAMKTLNNFLGATHFAAAIEALKVGREFGLDPAVMVDVINSSSGRSVMSENLLKQQVLNGRFDFGFAVGLMAKDVGIAAALAEQIGIDNPIGRLSCDLWAEAREALGPERDHTEAALVWDKRATKPAAK